MKAMGEKPSLVTRFVVKLEDLGWKEKPSVTRNNRLVHMRELPRNNRGVNSYIYPEAMECLTCGNGEETEEIISKE